MTSKKLKTRKAPVITISEDTKWVSLDRFATSQGLPLDNRWSIKSRVPRFHIREGIIYPLDALLPHVEAMRATA